MVVFAGCSSIDYNDLLKDRYGNLPEGTYGCAPYHHTELCLFIYDSDGNNAANNLPLTQWNVDHTCWQENPYYVEHSLVDIHQFLDGDKKELPPYSTRAQELTVESGEAVLYGHNDKEKYVCIRLMTEYGDALDEEKGTKEHLYKVTLKCLPLFGDDEIHEISISMKRAFSEVQKSYVYGKYIFTKLSLDGKAITPVCPEKSSEGDFSCSMTINR